MSANNGVLEAEWDFLPPSEALPDKGRIMDCTVLCSSGSRFLKEALAALDIDKREPK